MQRALQAVKRLAKPRLCPNTSFLRWLPELLLGAAPALSVCAHAQMTATCSSFAGATAFTRSTGSQPQTASEQSTSQVNVPHKLSFSVQAPAFVSCEGVQL